MTDKEFVFSWIKANVKEEEFENFYDEEDEEENPIESAMDWFAYEVDLFHHHLAPKTPIKVWLKRNYKASTFFEDHEKQAKRYYL